MGGGRVLGPLAGADALGERWADFAEIATEFEDWSHAWQARGKNFDGGFDEGPVRCC